MRTPLTWIVGALGGLLLTVGAYYVHSGPASIAVKVAGFGLLFLAVSALAGPRLRE